MLLNPHGSVLTWLGVVNVTNLKIDLIDEFRVWRGGVPKGSEECDRQKTRSHLKRAMRARHHHRGSGRYTVSQKEPHGLSQNIAPIPYRHGLSTWTLVLDIAPAKVYEDNRSFARCRKSRPRLYFRQEGNASEGDEQRRKTVALGGGSMATMSLTQGVWNEVSAPRGAGSRFATESNCVCNGKNRSFGGWRARTRCAYRIGRMTKRDLRR